MERTDLVSTARVGRSLGVHLILATQKPAGAVSEDIWGCSRFRICLRTEHTADSQELLRRPDAAFISRRTPGRAYLQVGTDEIFELFQSAYGALPYRPRAAEEAQAAVYAVALNGERRRLWPPPDLEADVPQTQRETLVARIRAAAQQLQLASLAGLWLPPLPEQVALDELPPAPPAAWLAPAVGLADDPERQRQAALTLPLGRSGHLLVFGAPGSGKTTLLQTLAVALARAHTPRGVQFYAIDFGRRLLKNLETLPHVGGVVLPDEPERLRRLFDLLEREMEARKVWLNAVGASTYAAYCEQTPEAERQRPALALLVDNYSELAANDPNSLEALLRLSREGGNLGLHLVLTATSPNLIPFRLSDNFALCVALELTETSDYAGAVGRPSVLPARGRRGRGLARGEPPLEVQVALPAAGASDGERQLALCQKLAAIAAQTPAGLRARRIPERPQVVELSELVLPEVACQTDLAQVELPVGVDLNTLEPCALPLAQSAALVIGGARGSGKTTLLQSLLLALAAQTAPHKVQMVLAGFGRPGLLPLAALPHVVEYATTATAFAARADALLQDIQQRRRELEDALRAAGGLLDEQQFVSRYPLIILAVDDWDQPLEGLPEAGREQVEALARLGAGVGVHVWLSGLSERLGSAADRVSRVLRAGQTGFVLGLTDSNFLDGLGVRVPYGEAGRLLPRGQGYFVLRGQLAPFLAATPQTETLSLMAWVARLRARSGAMNLVD